MNNSTYICLVYLVCSLKIMKECCLTERPKFADSEAVKDLREWRGINKDRFIVDSLDTRDRISTVAHEEKTLEVRSEHEFGLRKVYYISDFATGGLFVKLEYHLSVWKQCSSYNPLLNSYCGCDRMFKQKAIQKNKGLFPHVILGYIPSLQGSHRGRNLRKLVSLYLYSRTERKYMQACILDTQLAIFTLVPFSLCNGATHILIESYCIT